MNKLRKIRTLRGVSQDDIAKETGIWHSTISRIERGVIPPTHEQKKKIATFFNVEEARIFPSEETAQMQKRWISVKAASEYLSIHEVTCRRLIDRGEIPASRVGRSVRIDFFKLEEIMEAREGGEMR